MYKRWSNFSYNRLNSSNLKDQLRPIKAIVNHPVLHQSTKTFWNHPFHKLLLFPTEKYILLWNLHIRHIDTKMPKRKYNITSVYLEDTQNIFMVCDVRIQLHFHFHILSRIPKKTLQNFFLLDKSFSVPFQADLELLNAKQRLSELR